MRSGGAQRQMLNLVLQFDKMGQDCCLIIYNNDIFYDDYFYIKNKIIIDKKFKYDLLWKLYKILKYTPSSGELLLVSFLNGPNVLGLILKIMLGRRLKWIVGIRNVLNPVRIRRALEFLCIAKSDLVISNSYSAVLGLNKLTANKMRVIWNGYEISRFNFRCRQGLRSGILRFLYVGRLSEQKNIFNMIFALEEFSRLIDESMELHIFGRDDWANSKSRSDFQTLLTSLKSSKLNIICMGESKDVFDNGIDYDLLLLVSYYEGFPNVICESMLSGTLVLASDVSDNHLILNNNRGYLVEVNRKSILLGLLKWFSDSDKRSKSIDARDFARENFSVNGMYNSYLDCINELQGV
jgi:glycosyltransferase involved in cell wall biosynthesis